MTNNYRISVIFQAAAYFIFEHDVEQLSNYSTLNTCTYTINGCKIACEIALNTEKNTSPHKLERKEKTSLLS